MSVSGNHSPEVRHGVNAKEMPATLSLLSANDLPAASAVKSNPIRWSGVGRLATSLLIHTMFATVVLLLAADLHSSYFARDATWEVNPILSAIAERFGSRVALVVIKAVDLVGLLWMYALWRYSRAHLSISLVLLGIAVVYANVVLSNYSH